MWNIILTIGSLVCCLYSIAQPYKNPVLAVEKRVEDLMKRMTLEEKVSQLGMIDAGSYKTDLKFLYCPERLGFVERRDAIGNRAWQI